MTTPVKTGGESARRSLREASSLSAGMQRRASRAGTADSGAALSRSTVRFVYSESVVRALKKHYDCYWFGPMSAKTLAFSIDIRKLNDIYDDYITMRSLQEGNVADPRAAAAAREEALRLARQRKQQAAQARLERQQAAHASRGKLPRLELSKLQRGKTYQSQKGVSPGRVVHRLPALTSSDSRRQSKAHTVR